MHSILIKKQINSKLLVGISIELSIKNNKTGELWRKMMPRIKEIQNKKNALKYSLQVYPNDYFSSFNPERTFTKYALVEVNYFENTPKEMIEFELEEGTYAVFHYKGQSNDPAIFDYIFNIWLPTSDYELDDRPHFEVIGEKFKKNDPDSEEEIWIPIIPKK